MYLIRSRPSETAIISLYTLGIAPVPTSPDVVRFQITADAMIACMTGIVRLGHPFY